MSDILDLQLGIELDLDLGSNRIGSNGIGWDGFRALRLLRCGGLAPFEDLSAFPLAFFICRNTLAA